MSFISDGASALLGCKSGVGARLKKEFPQLVLWHCLNHRLELSVSDAIDSIHGFYHAQSFFGEVYSLYSCSPKLKRALSDLAVDLGVELQKIGRIFTIR